MSTTFDHHDRVPLARCAHHPLYVFLIAAAVPLFLGALLSDIAYAYSYQVQWLNFASWLIAGGLVFGAVALVWASINLFSGQRAGALPIFFILLATWVGGFINALIHARDAWAAMPAALVLSVIVLVLASIAAWMVFARVRDGGVVAGGVA